MFINTLAAGGTFRRRANPESDYVVEVAWIAKVTERCYPVRLIWPRQDDITGGRYRPLYYHRVAAAIGRDGKVVVANAVRAATGIRLHSMPFDLTAARRAAV